MKEKAGNLVLKALGLLLLVAAVLKGYELLTEPVANADIWSNRYFLIFTVEFELALGIWLLSGLLKRVAWLVALTCFSLFCCVTLYKALAGYGSCGCFGKVHVNPWVTLFAIDLPAVVLLGVFKPKLEADRVFHPLHWLKPAPNIFEMVLIIVIAVKVVLISITTISKITTKNIDSYRVLEIKTWTGQELPILRFINIADRLREGDWLIVLYNGMLDTEAVEKVVKGEGVEHSLQIAPIAVPQLIGHQENKPSVNDTQWTWGHLDEELKWHMALPLFILTKNGTVIQMWQGVSVPIVSDDVAECLPPERRFCYME